MGGRGSDPSALALLKRFGEVLPLPFSVLRPDQRSLWVNTAYCDLVGLPYDEVIVRTVADAVHPDDLPVYDQANERIQQGESVEVEMRVRHRNGQWVQVAWAMRHDPESDMVLAIGLNVTDERRRTRKLRHQADHDALTGAVNRSVVMRALDRWAGSREPIAVAIIDLDGFKQINDRMGHRVGDAVLMAVVTRLHEIVPADAVIGRMGGDEFVVLAPGIGTDGLHELADRLRQLTGPHVVMARSLRISASIGVTGGTARDPEQLLHEADVAAYVAKRGGPGRVQVFDADLRAAEARRIRTEERLVDALSSDGLKVHLQPVVSLADGSLRGVEALARLRGPDGLSPADEFVAVAHSLGLMGAVSRRVRDEALVAMAELPEGLELFLNLDSGDLLAEEGLADVVALAASQGVTPDRLVLELTESMLVQDLEQMVAQLKAVRAQGVRIAIDGLGVGTSSLSLLTRLPVDVLKVDRSLVAAARARPAALAVLRAAVSVGPALGIDVMLEGIEHPEDLVLARDLEVSAVQGHLLGHPVTVTELLADIDRGRLQVAAPGS